MIGSNVGGIPLQIEDGVTGYPADSVEQCTARALQILREPAAAAELGRRGREEVRQKFLSTAKLRNYLKLIAALSA